MVFQNQADTVISDEWKSTLLPVASLLVHISPSGVALYVIRCARSLNSSQSTRAAKTCPFAPYFQSNLSLESQAPCVSVRFRVKMWAGGCREVIHLQIFYTERSVSELYNKLERKLHRFGIALGCSIVHYKSIMPCKYWYCEWSS